MIPTLVVVSALSLAGVVGPDPMRFPRTARPPLTQVDVSSSPGAQFESTVVVAPTDPSVLLAGSNGIEHGRFDILAYTSTDSGASWVTSRPYTGSECAIADPGTAIDRDGRELFSYLVAPCHSAGDQSRTSVYVSSRRDPAGSWTAVRVARPLALGSIDKPAIAWDSSPASPYEGRAYLAWVRIQTSVKVRSVPKATLLVAHSDDGGATWSEPVQIRSPTVPPSNLFPSLAVAPSGALDVAWTNDAHAVFVARASDGGESFAPATTVEGDTFFANACPVLQVAAAVPAQSRRCVTTTPTLVAGATGVTVVYAAPGADGREFDVFARNYDPLLRPLHTPVRVNPADGNAASDQFEPVAALDPETGLTWVCFYDTNGDRTRRSVRFSCTATRDGLRWRRPVAVASVRSNETRPPATRFQYGDYQGLAIGGDGVAHPIWTDSRNLRSRGEEIYTTRLTVEALRRQRDSKEPRRLTGHPPGSRAPRP